MLKDLVFKNRSYRRFYENEKIGKDTLKELVDLARLSASSVNFQVLKYLLVCDEENNAKVFDTLAWAGLLKDWKGPEKGERPSAYIVILTDLSLGSQRLTDVGIAAQSLLLGAAEKELGGCMIGSIRREQLAKDFNIDLERFTIDLVIALGKPKETVKIVDIPQNGSTAYFRDENGVHYVPKRTLNDIIL